MMNKTNKELLLILVKIKLYALRIAGFGVMKQDNGKIYSFVVNLPFACR